MIGRFLGAPVLRRFKPARVLALCASFAGALVTASMLLGGHTAMWTILTVGLFNSIMFSTIFSLGVAELGPLTGSEFGLLNMAIGGGGILPVIQGVIADHVGIHHALVLPVICYVYILFYGLSGSKPNSERYARAYKTDCGVNHADCRRHRRYKNRLGDLLCRVGAAHALG